MPPRLQAPTRLPLPRPVLELLRRHERIQGPSGRRGSARGDSLPETGSTSLPPRHCEQEGWQVATVPRGDCQRQRQGPGRLADASEAQPRQVQSPIEHVQGRVCVAGGHHDVRGVEYNFGICIFMVGVQGNKYDIIRYTFVGIQAPGVDRQRWRYHYSFQSRR